MTDIIKSVRKFTEAVGCTTDRYNVRQTALYTGLQLEEMAERMDAVFGEGNCASQYLEALSICFKRGDYDDRIATADRAAMLDADIDLAWVTIGSALSQGANVEGAAGVVAMANLSKLVRCECDVDGIWPPSYDPECKKCGGLGLFAIKDENGKVKKPKGWKPPNIETFVCKAEGGKAQQ